MKSKFKYFGHLSLLFILTPLSLSLPFLFAHGTNLTIKDNLLWYLYFQLLFIMTIFWLWKKVLTEIIEIEISEKKVVLKNIVTRRIRIVPLNAISGFRSSFWNEKVSFRDKNENILFRLNDGYYRNFIEIINNIEKPYLGKEKGFFRK